jgi:hypothetical protein
MVVGLSFMVWVDKLDCTAALYTEEWNVCHLGWPLVAGDR